MVKCDKGGGWSRVVKDSQGELRVVKWGPDWSREVKGCPKVNEGKAYSMVRAEVTVNDF